MSGMIIYLGRLLPAASSDLPEAGGPRQRFCSVLLRMGFTCALPVTRKAVVSYTALPPLPAELAVYFCCTFLGVASTGRYPASCPMKPGLSSPAVFRPLQPRSFILLAVIHDIIIQPYLHQNVKNYFLYMKAASADKFPQNRISANVLTGHLQKIIQKLQQPLCLYMLRAFQRNRKQQRLCIHFQHSHLIN